MTRRLWIMRRSADLPTPVAVAGEHAIRPFRPGDPHDRAELLRVNAAAFAWHPEQGDMDEADLDRRMAEPWFEAHGLLMVWGRARSGERRLDAFHWTKVHADDEYAGLGEVYVLAVDPERQGHGLGGLALAAGLEHLAAVNPGRDVILWVEHDNEAAIGLYEREGFTRWRTVTP